MKDKLTVALVQTDLVWENPVLNRSLIEKKILNEKSKIDLFITGNVYFWFYYDSKYCS